jgi:phosphoribosyl-AMP cyclohydrolase
MLSEKAFETIKWDANGLIPAIVQDASTKQVLMMAYMNAEALKRSMELGETVFWSRSRQAFWHKGETSGNIQKISEIRIDCDADTLLILVEPAGAACHTGREHCFYRNLSEFDENPTRE